VGLESSNRIGLVRCCRYRSALALIGLDVPYYPPGPCHIGSNQLTATTDDKNAKLPVLCIRPRQERRTEYAVVKHRERAMPTNIIRSRMQPAPKTEAHHGTGTSRSRYCTYRTVATIPTILFVGVFFNVFHAYHNSCFRILLSSESFRRQ
jgi:hypothetical protein